MRQRQARENVERGTSKPVDINGAGLSKPRSAPHCMVLPLGEFNSVIPDSLSVSFASFMMIAATVSCNVEMLTKLTKK